MYNIHNYGNMILDAGRTKAYEKALVAWVGPGSVVVDIGTGTGIFALIACRLGARRVFAIEPAPAIAIAREIAAVNGFADRIEFFEARSTEVTLPERADVLVSDLRGILPFFRRHIETIIDARKRLLQPGAAMIPASDALWACAVESPELHGRVRGPWTDNEYGFDMSAASRSAANSYSKAFIRPQEMLTERVHLATLDYRKIDDTSFACRVELPVARDGTAHGIGVWFDAALSRGNGFSNAPGEPPLVYGNAFFPWPEPVAVQRGDTVQLALRADPAGDEYIWTWRSRILASDGAPRAEFDQSDFLADALSPQTLRKQAASYVPTLNDEGRIDRFILERMDEGRTLADIARELSGLYPGRFARWQDALTRVGELSVRYGR